jgi:serine/threonine protein kinase
LLYQMLTGIVPFRGINPVAIVMKHLRDTPVPPSRINPTIPLSVEQVILQTLEKDPQRRFHTARALANAFRQACGYESTHVAPVPVLAIENMPTQQVGIRVVPNTSSSLARSPLTKYAGIIIAASILVLLLLIFSISHAFGAPLQHSQHLKPPVTTISTISASPTPNMSLQHKRERS